MAWFRRKQPEKLTAEVPADPIESAVVEEVAADFVTDAPIEDSKQDRFGRDDWAYRVAETIATQRDPASLVVGIYGPWGDGKTSVLNLVFERLNEAEGVVPVRFNPWRLGDETEIFRGFFATLADALDEQVASTSERVGQTLRDYGGLLVAVPVVGGALKEGAGAAGAKLSETNLAKQRKKIEDLLEKHAQRIVILIDDIDRLDKSEIQAMFRLVKVAADFQHTAYVLAFDHRVVASALAERYAAEPAHGASFMDKIIQLPLHLPPAPPETLRALALEVVDAALAEGGVTLSDEEAGAFVSAFDRAVGPRLATPRAAKRYGNALLFSLPMISAEVHPVDLMLLEAMRICYPPLYEWVRSHETEVLGPYAVGVGSEHPALATLREGFDAATDGLTSDDVARARTLLSTLLPRTESAWGNKTWGSDWEEPWGQEKRLASRLYFRRYFTYTVPPGDVADADLNALLAAAGEIDADTEHITLLAAAVFDAGGTDKVLPKLAARIPNLASHSAKNLALAVTAVSDRLSEGSGLFGLSPLERTAILVRDLLAQVRREERGDLVVTMMREAQELPFAVEIVRWIRPQGDDPEGHVVSRDECDAAGGVLARRLLDVWCSGDPFTRLSRTASASLHVVSTYGDGDALRDCLRGRIDDDIAFAFALIRSFLGQAWDLETGVPRPPNLRRETYDAIAEYVDPAWLSARIQQEFGDEIGKGDEQSSFGYEGDKRLGDQYVRLARSDADAADDQGAGMKNGLEN